MKDKIKTTDLRQMMSMELIYLVYLIQVVLIDFLKKLKD